MAMDVEAEIRDLKRCVGELDLLAFEARTEQRFERVDQRFDKVEGRLDRLDSGLRGLRENTPGIASDAVRPLPRRRSREPRK
jgi:hypothetical protein